MNQIRRIDALEVLDSRGFPTIEAVVTLEYGAQGRAIVPSGASTGRKEAHELRDGGTRYGGRGVRHAVRNVLDIIAPALAGDAFARQADLDDRLIALDGTVQKTVLGANAMLAVSMAFARACAVAAKKPLHEHLAPGSALLPVPCLNVINGGAHADSTLDFQEFKILPHGATSFAESIEMGEGVFHALKKRLGKSGYSTAVGDEGGFAPHLKSHEEAVEIILDAIVLARYRPSHDVSIGLDPAVSAFWQDNGTYVFPRMGITMDSGELIDLWDRWLKAYPIRLLEDPMGEDDWEGWVEATKRLGNRVELVGDDLFCTNPAYVEMGIQRSVANSVLIKPNQIGTLTETFACAGLAQSAGYGIYVSHRSGETEDSFIADLAVALGGGHLKTGSGCRGERTAKFNQLLRIERELGSLARFPGGAAFKTLNRTEAA
ncbi:phosphopyruvate hydratase [Luteibacter anthropi]|uniref:phosphopyruvate hydratase n=1 Tax=Luteibacter anthropi TaxID=564369 RepID=UPI002033087D|nr:phosphopyruvate hydratase [Luteibacter anthropi]URX61714.1 phosphopyruvate hydratase [Luteibacter anthropi]